MKKFFPKIKPLICFLLCIAVFIIFLCLTVKDKKVDAVQEKNVLTVWQIDSFEGGRGSRADFIQKIGKDFSDKNSCYVSVVSLSEDAAVLNLKEGNIPDIISYGAGISGLENHISSYKTWCHGGYCVLTVDANADFSDINSENVIINEGKGNLVSAAALFCGLQGAATEKPTAAYVKLINGGYKYLLGTQRDIYRLKTRGVSFAVKPVRQFNDLYQNISVVTESKNAKSALNFIDYLMSRTNEVINLGLLSENTVYDDEMKIMQGISYEYKLTAPVSADTKNQLQNLISAGDINMLKNLLK